MEPAASRQSTAATRAAATVPDYRWRTEGELRAAVAMRAMASPAHLNNTYTAATGGRASAPPSRQSMNRSALPSRSGAVATRGHVVSDQPHRSAATPPLQKPRAANRFDDASVRNVASWFEDADFSGRWESTEPPLLPDVFQPQDEVPPTHERDETQLLSRPLSQASTRVGYATSHARGSTPALQKDDTEEFDRWLSAVLDDVAPLTHAAAHETTLPNKRNGATPNTSGARSNLASAKQAASVKKMMHTLLSVEDRSRQGIARDAALALRDVLLDFHAVVNKQRVKGQRFREAIADVVLREKVSRAAIAAEWQRERAVEWRAFDARRTTLEQRQRIIRASCRTGGYGDDDKAVAQGDQQVALTLTSAEANNSGGGGNAANSTSASHLGAAGAVSKKVLLAVSRSAQDVAPSLEKIPLITRQRMAVSAQKNSVQLREELAALVPEAIEKQWHALLNGRDPSSTGINGQPQHRPSQATTQNGRLGRNSSARSDASSLRPTAHSTPSHPPSPGGPFGASLSGNPQPQQRGDSPMRTVSFIKEEDHEAPQSAESPPQQRLVLKAGSLRLRAGKSRLKQPPPVSDNSPIMHAASFSSIGNASGTSSATASDSRSPAGALSTPAPGGGRGSKRHLASATAGPHGLEEPHGERTHVAQGLKNLLARAGKTDAAQSIKTRRSMKRRGAKSRSRSPSSQQGEPRVEEDFTSLPLPPSAGGNDGMHLFGFPVDSAALNTPTFDTPALEVRDSLSGSINPWFGAIARRGARRVKPQRSRSNASNSSHSPGRNRSRADSHSRARSAPRRNATSPERSSGNDDIALWVLYGGIEDVCGDAPPNGCLTMHLTLSRPESSLFPPGLTQSEIRAALRLATRLDAPGQRFAASLGDEFGCLGGSLRFEESASQRDLAAGGWCLDEADTNLIDDDEEHDGDAEREGVDRAAPAHFGRHKSMAALSEYSW